MKKCLEKCIELSGFKKGVILDCFMGTGTTGKVAKQMNLDFIGIEIDEDYFNFAKNRIKSTLC